MAQAATKTGKMLALGVPVLNEAAAMGRSILLAQMLGAEELGRAMLLALSLRLVEMAADLSIERLLVVAPDGDDADLQANLQGAVLLRGLVMSLGLLALAWPMAHGLTDGPALLSYAALAMVPLIRAGMHLDYRRAERRFDYRGLSIVEGGGALLMLAATPLLALWWGDHRAIVGILLAQVVGQVALSHLVAQRRYALRFDRAALLRVWAFGAPLVLNALLMFVTFQADRLIVAGFFTWSDVAVYSVALQLAMLPAQILGRAAGSLLAPRLRLAREAGQIAARMPRILAGYAAVAGVFLLGFGLLAAPVMQFVYGAEFAPAAVLVWLLGAAASARILRTPLSQLAVVTGRTGDPARSNLWRAGAILPALACALLGAPLAALAAAAAAGEAAATARAWHLMSASVTSHPPKGPVSC